MRRYTQAAAFAAAATAAATTGEQEPADHLQLADLMSQTTRQECYVTRRGGLHCWEVDLAQEGRRPSRGGGSGGGRGGGLGGGRGGGGRGGGRGGRSGASRFGNYTGPSRA